MALIRGTKGANNIEGSNLADVIHGLAGRDMLWGNGGNDEIDGGYGDDTIVGGTGGDLIHGGAGNDFIVGDNLWARNAGDDRIDGGAGDDVIRPGGGVDQINGGDGIDLIDFNDGFATRGVIIDLAIQTIVDDGFRNYETIRSIEGVEDDTVFADELYGSSSADILTIDAGDTAIAGDGNDLIRIGSIDQAFVSGGNGIDGLLFEGSTLRLTAGRGVRRVDATTGVEVDLAAQQVRDDGFGKSADLAGIENVFGGDLDDVVAGSSGANLIEGRAGDDRLSGEGGQDILFGGAGSDRLSGGRGADVFRFDDSDLRDRLDAVDVITDFRRGDLIDLTDARVGREAGTFTFLGTAQFTGAAGEVRFESRDGATIVLIEADGVAGVDHTIRLDGRVPLTGADFLL